MADVELTWTSPNAKIPFSNYEEACSYSIANYCSFVPGSGCISTSAGGVSYYYNGGRPYATCGGTVTFEYYDQGVRKTRTFTDNVLDAVYSAAVKFVLTNPSENPQPKQCAGNPIDISTGIKIQQENDIVAEEKNQLGFTRYFNGQPTPPAKYWNYSYHQSLSFVDPTYPSMFSSKSPLYSDRNSACVSGWNNLKTKITQSWAINTTASLSGDICQIKKNGVITRNLIVMKNVRIGLVDESHTIVVHRPDGSQVAYIKQNTVWKAANGAGGIIKKIMNGDSYWQLAAENGEIEEYSREGKLISITGKNGIKQQLLYDPITRLLSKVKATTGKELLFSYNANQLTGVTDTSGKTTIYSYNASGLITQVTRPDSTQRQYHYEDSRFPYALTGITDERGLRYATWTYDAQGRAITSEHANGVEKTTLTFNVDGSTTVTNALNKNTIYNFADITGARRVTKVQGMPTANCVGANQDYTYTLEGWIASKTDWKGIKTTFIYNAIGQEISRTEAFGTPDARTITTEWHPTLYQKTKVTEPDKETIYNYDSSGRLLNQTTNSLIAQ